MRRAGNSLDRGGNISGGGNRGGGNRGGSNRGGDDVEITLQRARSAHEPSLADQQRVLASLRDRLGSAPSWPPAEHDITGVRRTLPRAASGPAARLSRLLGRSATGSVTLQRVVLIGALTGALGFWLGSRGGDDSDSRTSSGMLQAVAPSVSAPASPAHPVATSREQANAPARSASGMPRSWAAPSDGAAPFQTGLFQSSPAAPSALQTLAPSWAATPSSKLSSGAVRSPAVTLAPVTESGAPALGLPAPPPVSPASAPLPPTPAPVQEALTRSGSRERSVQDRAAQNGSEMPSGARAKAAAPKFASEPFLEAVRLLQRAQRAVDGGEPALAMFLLGELDTRFPRQLLSEERAATRVLALCESGETDRAHQVALELNLQSPTSIYAARIARSCVSLADGAGLTR